MKRLDLDSGELSYGPDYRMMPTTVDVHGPVVVRDRALYTESAVIVDGWWRIPAHTEGVPPSSEEM